MEGNKRGRCKKSYHFLILCIITGSSLTKNIKRDLNLRPLPVLNSQPSINLQGNKVPRFTQIKQIIKMMKKIKHYKEIVKDTTSKK